jgi:5'-nucleotidase
MEEWKLINRRTFVKNISLAGIAFPVMKSIPFHVNSKKIKKLTILHTNDMHSHIDPFSVYDSKYPGMGGMTRVASLINNIRAVEKNVLLLDAGDIFQGTPYFNRYKGKLELQIMSQMGYAASTMGNHDFDNGIEGFNNVLNNANFPFLCSNYDFNDTILKNKTKPYKILSFDSLRVGILGIGIQLDGLVEKRLYKKTKYLDPIEQANYWAKYLKKDEKCDFIICLSHLGYEYQSNKISDLYLAEESENINLIIGGHTHTFLKEAKTVINKKNQKVIVNQAGWGALALGRVDIYFDKKTDNNHSISSIDVSKKNYAKI